MIWPKKVYQLQTLSLASSLTQSGLYLVLLLRKTAIPMAVQIETGVGVGENWLVAH